MPKVIVQFQGQEYSVDLREGANVIGRSSKCTIPLRDTNTSREHCEIQFAKGVATVLDKGSMNGTLVNGKKVAEHKLIPGDKIVIGQTAIFFESKPAGAEATPVEPPPASADIPTQPAKPQSEIRKPAKAAKAETRRGSSVAALIKDYGKMGSDRGGLAGALIGVVVGIAVIGVAAFLVLRGPGGAAVDDDPDNLIKYGDFEAATASGVQGWTTARTYKSTASSDSTQAHHGKSSLHIDKKGDSSDIVYELVTMEQFPLRKATKVEASAFARVDGFTGWCAIKINWLTGANGSVILEEYSDPAPKPADWAALRKEFNAPPGAAAFTIALVAVGRSGHVYFDEVKAYTREGGAPPKDIAFKPFTFAVSPAGVLIIGTEDRRVLTNVQIALDSAKEGQTWQALAEGVKVTADDKKIEIKGRLVNPADMQSVNFEIEIRAAEGEVKVGARCFGEGMRVVDRMLLTMVVPRADRISGLPGANEAGTPRVTVFSEGADVVLEYAELLKVTAEPAGRGGKRLVHIVPVDPATGDVAMALSLRRGSGSEGSKNPIGDANALAAKQKFGDALRILMEALKTEREPAKRDQLLAEVRKHDAHEADDWSDLQSKAFLAQISRRDDLYTSLQEATVAYQRHWAGEPFATKLQKFREEFEAGWMGSSNDEDRAKRLMDQAKAYRDKGQRTMAIALCELIGSLYQKTKSAAEALELLKSLRQ